MLPSGKLQEHIVRVLFLDKNFAFTFGLHPGYDPFQKFFPTYIRLLFLVITSEDRSRSLVSLPSSERLLR